MEKLEKLETALNNFDPAIRAEALTELAALMQQNRVETAPSGLHHNLHCHTFFSFNGYGFSPSYIAWLARKQGFFAVGSVDFDVLDATDEFLNACDLLDIRGVSGLETRAFIPEFADREINSPGEPGISYHMGAGFVASKVPDDQKAFLDNLRQQANDRTKRILDRVNQFLDVVQLDYETEVKPLTPSGNTTERHVCQAYFAKAEAVLPDAGERTRFWSGKLGTPVDAVSKIINDPVALQGMIRSKTMKSGGVGYVKPDPAAFPLLKDLNQFVSACGALPVLTWLNGESAGEDALEELLDLHDSLGMAVVNIIPDRNWNYPDSEVKKAKVFQLNRFIKAATARDLPIIVGTEMNAPGQKLVDDFNSDALADHTQTFADGATVVYAHSKLQPFGFGYNSEWATAEFTSRAAKNQFFCEFGKRYSPDLFAKIAEKLPHSDPKSLINNN